MASAQAPADSLFAPLGSDSLAYTPALSLADTVPGDSTLKDSSETAWLGVPTSDQVETTIFYSARDSMVMDMTGQEIALYGDSKVDYQDKKIESYEMSINWQTNMIGALGRTDTAGNYVERPIFTDAGAVYEVDSMAYNSKSKRAIIHGVITRQGEGWLTGETTYRDQDNTMYIKKGIYCPCDDPTSGTYIRSNKIKVVPDERIVSGPLNLWVADLPTPLVAPFGIFPATNRRASGIIVPTYGESADRGFFLRNGGYYYGGSEFIGVSLLGQIYTRGGWGADLISDYKKRYTYDGNVEMRYNKRINNAEEVNEAVVEDYWFTWNHTQTSLRATRFSAQVNIGTTTYNANNAFEAQNYLASTFQSTISYYTPLGRSPYSLGMNLRHDLNTQTGIHNFTLPEMNLSMNRIYPFQKPGVSRKGVGRLIQTLNFSHRLDGRLDITNAPRSSSLPFNVSNEPNDSLIVVNLANAGLLADRSRIGFKHQIPVSASMPLGPVVFNPSFTYTEYWYVNQLGYSYSGNDSVRVDTLPGFARAGEYIITGSFNTNYYGRWAFDGKRERQIRHVITPNVAFNYKPDFRYAGNAYQEVQVSDDPNDRVFASRFQGFNQGTPSAGEVASISFAIRQSFEMKYRTLKRDSSKFEKVKLLDNLEVNSAYNFAADSLNLSDFNFVARTSAIQGLNINGRMTVTPYTYQLDTLGNQRRVNEYAWNVGQGLGQIERANLSIGASFNPDAFKRRKAIDEESSVKGTPEEKERIAANPEEYIDWTVPWNLGVSYNLDYTQVGFNPSRVTQSLSAYGDVSLTPKWKVGFNTGYDLTEDQLTYTSINVYRDLNCWELLFNWIPYGPRQSYNIDIRIKASLLQDLKLSRRRSWYDR